MIPMESRQQADQKRIDSDFYVEGYATTFKPYVLFEDEDGPIYESFTRDSFKDTDMSDVILQYDHSGKVLARMRNNTLIVEVDDNGLFVGADLSKSEASRALYEEISNGLVDRMSWGFIPGEYHLDRKTRTIVHTKVKKIFDCSAVSIPANENTFIGVRSFCDGEFAKMAQELREHEEAKNKLLLKLKLGDLL